MSSAYLQPLFDRFGAHQGLNADWCTMAWSVGGGLWILDDELDDRVSIVRRWEEGDDQIFEEVLCSVSVHDALSHLMALLMDGEGSIESLLDGVKP